MVVLRQFRHNLDDFVGRCVFPLVYLGGALLLLLGLIFSAQAWWTLVHHHGSPWAIGTTTVEVFVLAAALSAILIIPRLQGYNTNQVACGQKERRGGAKRNLPSSE